MSKISAKAARVNIGLSQTELALKLGVTKPTYAKWERDIGNMPLKKFNMFCEITGCEKQDIVLPSSQL